MNLFFDLDGTLTESGEGITNSFKSTFKKYNVDYSNLDLKKFIGPTLKETFSKHISEDEKIIEEAINFYRSDFVPNRMLYENKLYDGALEMVSELKKKGHKLFIATGKGEALAIKVVEHFKLAPYFDGVFGFLYDGTRNSKTDVLKDALRITHSNAEESFMIGDTKYDLIAAAAFNVFGIGCLYGYGGEELSTYPHVFLAKTPTCILNYFNTMP